MIESDGDTIIPDYERSVYNLASSISEILNKRKGKPLKEFEIKKKVVLILMDGMGEGLLKKTGLNINHDVLTSVFPSTTCTVMSTLITADVPAKHGIIGFLGYDKISGNLINLLDFENGKKYQAEEYRNSVERIFSGVKSILVDLDRKPAMLLPFFSLNAPIVQFLTRGAELRPYINIWDGISQAIQLSRSGTDFIFFYIPFVDIVSHHYGPYSDPTVSTAREIMDQIIKYSAHIPMEYDVIITSDHGQIEVSGAKMLDQRLVNSSRAPVLGDVRMHIFQTDEKIESPHENYRIYPYSEISYLFGGDGEMDRKLSIGIAFDRNIYLTEITRGENYMYRGHHSSLLREEMEVPLINLRKINIQK